MSFFAWGGIREFLKFLREKGDLREIEKEIEPEWEVNGLTRKCLEEEGPALLFKNIKGAEFPLLCNLLGTDRRYLWSLGIEDWTQFNDEWCERVEDLTSYRTIEKKGAPCKENSIKSKEINLEKICNVKWHEEDRGPFIGTLSVAITKDPDTGWLNAGIYRMDILSENTTGLGIPEYTHARQHLMKYEERGKDMPMACITGYDPIIEIAASTRTRPGVSEFELAGSLRGEPIEMVECETIDLKVPASAEFVFEGIVPADERVREGPFGEYTGYYGNQRTNPKYEINLITHRNNAIFQGAREQWRPSESFYAVGKSSQAEAYRTIKDLVPGILDLRCDVSYEAIVKINKMFKGHAQQVMDAVWGSTYARYKHVIVVDEDIDIWDYDSVHWALSTRVKADRDVTILSRRAGQWLDPAPPPREKGWQGCLGIDATRPKEDYEYYDEEFPQSVADPDIVKRVEDKWGKELKEILE